MYSIEPPLYGDLNKACRNMDHQKLETLGPYARVLYEVLFNGKVQDEIGDDAVCV